MVGSYDSVIRVKRLSMLLLAACRPMSAWLTPSSAEHDKSGRLVLERAALYRGS
jgi:hypothetical protein